ncbi:MAG: hypothetical protein BHW58_07345 [Azospirillum sp. 51_20]|nr:MAG: hypothetical protein BHW58_07345 [Azospirillum sp. 51_20]
MAVSNFSPRFEGLHGFYGRAGRFASDCLVQTSDFQKIPGIPGDFFCGAGKCGVSVCFLV